MKYFWFLLIILPVGSANAKSCMDIFVQAKVRETISTESTITVDQTERRLQIFKPEGKIKKYKALIYFHGTNLPVDIKSPADSSYGTHYEAQFIRKLTEQGFVVIAPESNSLPGFIPYTFFPTHYKAWEANIPPYSSNFESSRDAKLASALIENFADIAGLSAPPQKLFLAGFSSGGYMASRLGNMEQFAGKIDGLVINAASYGTCLGASCSLPSKIPDYHPPTLLISNKDDSVVPFETVYKYGLLLKEQSVPVQAVFNEKGDHAWLETQIDPILNWFN